jgi:hypothetical protein
VRLAIGEHNDLAGFERDGLSADGRGEAPAGRDDVIRNQMIGARQNFRQDQLARRRPNSPWLLGRDLEGRPRQSGARFLTDRITDPQPWPRCPDDGRLMPDMDTLEKPAEFRTRCQAMRTRGHSVGRHCAQYTPQCRGVAASPITMLQ